MKKYYVYGWNETDDGRKCGGLLTDFDCACDELARQTVRKWFDFGRIPNDHYSIIADGKQIDRV